MTFSSADLSDDVFYLHIYSVYDDLDAMFYKCDGMNIMHESYIMSPILLNNLTSKRSRGDLTGEWATWAFFS